MEKRALNYYTNAADGLGEFDKLFAANATDTLTYLTWLSQMPDGTAFTDPTQYAAAMSAWQAAKPTLTTEAGKTLEDAVGKWQAEKPQQSSFGSAEQYAAAMAEWAAASPATAENGVKIAYMNAVNDLQEYVYAKALAIDSAYTRDSSEAKEMLGSVMYTLNSDGMFNESFYLKYEKQPPEEYDYMSIIAHIQSGDVNEYIVSDERVEFRLSRAEGCASMFLAGNMAEDENVKKIVGELSSYGVTMDKYESFGYTYESIKHLAYTSAITCRNRLDYELGLLADKYADGGYDSEEAYNKAIEDKTAELNAAVTSSLLSALQ